MRERLARAVAIVTVMGLAGLSAAFAWAQNPEVTSESMAGEAMPQEPTPQESTVAEPSPAPEPASVASLQDTLRARVLFDELGCSACHSVGELGNPRNPLDGVGSRRTPAEIRAWTVGEGPVADSLPPGALRVKGAYLDVPADDLQLVLDWLTGLKAGAGGT